MQGNQCLIVVWGFFLENAEEPLILNFFSLFKSGNNLSPFVIFRPLNELVAKTMKQFLSNSHCNIKV